MANSSSTETTTTGSYAGLLVFRYPVSRLPEAYIQLAGGGWLSGQPGLSFLKYGGTGRGRGFSANPDFSRFALFSVWNSREDWHGFLEGSPFTDRLKRRVKSLWAAGLTPLTGFGEWDKQTVFGGNRNKVDLHDRPLAVLTRASIRLAMLRDFWRHVPGVTKQLEATNGCLYTLGFGELPWVRQATFSIWESADTLRDFAYGQGGAHSTVVERTRERGWYSEEMFYRFSVDEARTVVPNANETFVQVGST